MVNLHPYTKVATLETQLERQANQSSSSNSDNNDKTNKKKTSTSPSPPGSLEGAEAELRLLRAVRGCRLSTSG